MARTCTCFLDMLAQRIPIGRQYLIERGCPYRIETDTSWLGDCTRPTSNRSPERLLSLGLPCQLPASAMLLSI
jgi:hypothetical protein